MKSMGDLYIFIPCEYCGARAGKRCETANGKKTVTHGARQGPLNAAYRLGYDRAYHDVKGN